MPGHVMCDSYGFATWTCSDAPLSGISDKWFDVEWFDSERGVDESMHVLLIKVELKAPKTKDSTLYTCSGIPSLVPASNKLQPLET
jgi:hypothetical protein